MTKTTHINPVTGRAFRAEEAKPLAKAMKSRAFAQPQWATYWQWKGQGRVVREGEQGVVITGKSGFQWRVYNVAQVEDQAEAARAPVAPATKPARASAKAKAAPKSKKSSAARGAAADSDDLFAGFRRQFEKLTKK
jgi:hypothetical protein